MLWLLYGSELCVSSDHVSFGRGIPKENVAVGTNPDLLYVEGRQQMSHVPVEVWRMALTMVASYQRTSRKARNRTVDLSLLRTCQRCLDLVCKQRHGEAWGGACDESHDNGGRMQSLYLNNGISIVRYKGSSRRRGNSSGRNNCFDRGCSRIALWWGLVLVASALLSSRLWKAEAHSQNKLSGRVER